MLDVFFMELGILDSETESSFKTSSLYIFSMSTPDLRIARTNLINLASLSDISWIFYCIIDDISFNYMVSMVSISLLLVFECKGYIESTVSFNC